MNDPARGIAPPSPHLAIHMRYCSSAIQQQQQAEPRRDRSIAHATRWDHPSKHTCREGHVLTRAGPGGSHKTQPRERRSTDAIWHRGHDFAWRKFTVHCSRVSRSVRIPVAARCGYYPTPLLVTDVGVCMHSQFHPDSGSDLRHHIWGLPAPEPLV